MKRTSGLLLVAALMLGLAAPAAQAQGNFGLNVGAEFLLPITEGFKDAYNIGIGGTLRGEYAVTPDFTLMLSAGYISLSGKEVNGVTIESGRMIPIMAGAKYYFMPGTLRFYGAFEAGITSMKAGGVSVTGLGPIDQILPTAGTVSLEAPSTTEFTWQPQLGFIGMFSDNAAFDLGVRWIGISDANALGVRFGVLFMFGGMKSGSPY